MRSLIRNGLIRLSTVAGVPVLCVSALFAQSPGGGAAPPLSDENRSAVRETDHLMNADIPPPWFSDQGVRKELGLTDEQLDKLNETYTESWGRYNSTISGINANTELNDEDRAARIARLQNTFQNNLMTGTEAALNDARQRDRYRQLYRQYQGYNAFQDPSIREKLALSDEQILHIARYGRNWDNALRTTREPILDQAATSGATGANGTTPGALGAGPELSSTRRNPSNHPLIEARRKLYTDINTVLTPEQQQAWGEVVGTPYDFGVDVLAPTGTYSATIDTRRDGTLGTGNNNSRRNQNNASNEINNTNNAGNANSLFPGNQTLQNGGAGNVNRAPGDVQPGRTPRGDVQPGRNPRGDVQPGRNPRGDVQPGRNPAGDVRPGANPTGPVQPGANPAGPVQPGANPSGPVQPGANPGGGVQPGANPGGGVQPGANPSSGN
jgi:hypothetical protein